MEKRFFNTVDERLDFIEFRQELLYYNDDVSRVVFVYNLTQAEYNAILSLMDNLRSQRVKGEKVYSAKYEQDIYNIAPHLNNDYHFCELIAKTFYEDNRYSEVFQALYGDRLKYSSLKDE